jgi:hypothetical protein
MEKIFVITVITGLVLSILLVGFVFATGSTFGQRCSAMGYTGLDHNNCVTTLSQGKEMSNVE